MTTTPALDVAAASSPTGPPGPAAARSLDQADPTAAPHGHRHLRDGLASLVAINSGGMGVLVPDLVARIDPAEKVGNLAWSRPSPSS